jgi:hypothetical protein
MREINETRWNIIKSMLDESAVLKERASNYLKAQ